MSDHLYYKLKSYLRKRGENDHYRFNVEVDSQGNWRISHWGYDIPQPSVSEIPNLTEEEYFVEYEDANYFSNDVYVVGTDGTIRPDRRPCLSGLVDNKINLEIGRFCIDVDSDLKLYVDNVETKHIVKAITPVRISTSIPIEETTLVIWKV